MCSAYDGLGTLYRRRTVHGDLANAATRECDWRFFASDEYACRNPRRPRATSGRNDLVDATLQLTIELDRETDGRWIAAIAELPGVLAYGATEAEAIERVKAVALVEIGDRIQHAEPLPGGGGELHGVSFRAA